MTLLPISVTPLPLPQADSHWKGAEFAPENSIYFWYFQDFPFLKCNIYVIF